MPLVLNSPAQQINRLRELGWAVDLSQPDYRLSETLRRFQQAHSLTVDGDYGPQTEGALFDRHMLTGTLTGRLLSVAGSQVGITEVPPGSNRSPQIDLILKSVGLSPGYPWCAAFVYWCFAQASRQTGLVNPCPKSAGVLNLWALAGYKEAGLTRITAQQAITNPNLIKPGMQFLMRFSPTTGHTGIVERVNKNGSLVTIEGNSNKAGSREGTAVLRQTKRTVSNINLGYISYE